jgi:hypothetical protein
MLAMKLDASCNVGLIGLIEMDAGSATGACIFKEKRDDDSVRVNYSPVHSQWRLKSR